VPIALKEIMKDLESYAAKMDKEMSDLTLLDAGCGTGSYIQKLHDKVGKIIGVE
jgi:ubiquinone/menaquinone biosynthesis C-methylase UbiE